MRVIWLVAIGEQFYLKNEPGNPDNDFVFCSGNYYRLSDSESHSTEQLETMTASSIYLGPGISFCYSFPHSSH